MSIALVVVYGETGLGCTSRLPERAFHGYSSRGVAGQVGGGNTRVNLRRHAGRAFDFMVVFGYIRR